MLDSDLVHEPDIRQLVSELRNTLGMFDGAMTISPKQAWDEAIAEVRRLRMWVPNE